MVLSFVRASRGAEQSAAEVWDDIEQGAGQVLGRGSHSPQDSLLCECTERWRCIKQKCPSEVTQ